MEKRESGLGLGYVGEKEPPKKNLNGWVARLLAA